MSSDSGSASADAIGLKASRLGSFKASVPDASFSSDPSGVANGRAVSGGSESDDSSGSICGGSGGSVLRVSEGLASGNLVAVASGTATDGSGCGRAAASSPVYGGFDDLDLSVPQDGFAEMNPVTVAWGLASGGFGGVGVNGTRLANAPRD